MVEMQIKVYTTKFLLFFITFFEYYHVPEKSTILKYFCITVHPECSMN